MIALTPSPSPARRAKGVVSPHPQPLSHRVGEGYTRRPAQEVERALAAEGVLCIALDPHRLRLVTHKDIDDAAIEHAIRAFRRVSGILS